MTTRLPCLVGSSLFFHILRPKDTLKCISEFQIKFKPLYMKDSVFSERRILQFGIAQCAYMASLIVIGTKIILRHFD